MTETQKFRSEVVWHVRRCQPELVHCLHGGTAVIYNTNREGPGADPTDQTNREITMQRQ